MTECKGTYGPNYPDDQNQSKDPCDTQIEGYPNDPMDMTCRPFQLSKSNDSKIIDRYTNEHLNIGGADLYVYKLLGVHEQGQLIDAVGFGQSISGGDLPSFPSSYAFDAYQTEWKSIQTGPGILASSYIGYDFGEIKIDGVGRQMYGTETSRRKHITAIALKQSSNENNRITKARVERSQNGKDWFGVHIINIPNDDCLNTLMLKHSVPSRYWRIRPLKFNGGQTDHWGIQAFQMFDNYLATDESNIQDKIFMENRDRDYLDDPLLIKGSYDLLDTQSELSRFGIEVPGESFYITVSFSACVAILGRPPIIGDIFEMPSEAQFSANLERVKKWVEVTDVSWSTEGYTPGWQPTLLRIMAQQAYASQETQDIFGDLTRDKNQNGLMDIDDGNHPIFQDYSDVSQTIEAESKEDVPQKGAEGSSHIRKFEQEEIEEAESHGVKNLNSIGLNSTGLYVEDAMPPNEEPYTEGKEFPDKPSDGDYHRVVYTGLAEDVPARLYRFSATKGRWIYLESDRRSEYDPTHPKLQEYLVSPSRRPTDNATKDNGEET